MEDNMANKVANKVDDSDIDKMDDSEVGWDDI